jgi:predicted alpha/beta hydrolase family esterase
MILHKITHTTFVLFLFVSTVACSAEPDTPSVPTTPNVILVPGLLASDGSMDSIRSAISESDIPPKVFKYPSSQGIKQAAALLSEELKTLKMTSPDRQVVLVTHSMGGLVARCCLEDPATNPGNVTRLIMIAPPNHGSAVAGLSAAELATRFSFTEQVGEAGLRAVDDVVSEFTGQAKDELKVGSEMLRCLNECAHAPGVLYTIFAGSGGPVSSELVSLTLLVSGLFASESPEVKAALDSAREIANMDEWTKGRGDGVVSIKSTRLDGVDDFVVLPFAHNDFGAEPTAAATQVIAEIKKRLTDSDRR